MLISIVTFYDKPDQHKIKRFCFNVFAILKYLKTEIQQFVITFETCLVHELYLQRHIYTAQTIYIYVSLNILLLLHKHLQRYCIS